MLYAAKSHIGLVRQLNEDGYAVHMEFQPWKLIVVADGVGGASAGEVASGMAVQAVCDHIHRRLEQVTDPQLLLGEAIQFANEQICQAAKETEAYEGMGTTIVAALLDSSQVFIAHAGDSRGYLYQNAALCQVTEDHSLVAELVRRGQLTEEEAMHHPQRHWVTRSLGTTEYGHSEISSLSWQTGDALLLCTDGLTDLVSTEELTHYLSRVAASTVQQELNDISDELIQVALERGAPDNITFILVTHREAGDAR